MATLGVMLLLVTCVFGFKERHCYSCDGNTQTDCNRTIECNSNLFCYGIFVTTNGFREKGCCSDLARFNNQCEQQESETYKCYSCQGDKCNSQ